ncbi:uncharacterized protein LOC113498346 isoform X2 [Trichoplusia ni]|uniref:Uncharacterized protein LOC113498346 isoform X2 n=1 Tax=Trichoplusia ni TaxID=7111 RepID=A0A7E5W0J9_TRINI|nr:uncharacterized protein LOC113498346 isoform X2 [Trichoplusia ni]
MSKYHIECKKSPICTNPSKQKVSSSANAACAAPKKTQLDPDLLGRISNAPCSCQVVARAVRDDVPHYIGLSNRRASIEAMASAPSELSCHECDPKEDKNKPASKSKLLSQSKIKSQSTNKSVEKK